MIRRDAEAEQGAKRWILISQIEHAHLAGRLAENWGGCDYAPLNPRLPLIEAVYHHDDGWRAWDDDVDVDPRTGRPRSFTEMELADSLHIWTASIEAASRIGNLPAYVVAGHFCALAQRMSLWRRDDPHWPLVERFLDDFARAMEGWLAGWQREDPARHTAAAAERGLRMLQFFDALSLWFCCAEATGPERIAVPEGIELTATSRGGCRVELHPWPLIVARLNLEIPARSIPVRQYASRAELRSVDAEPVRLRWTLEAGPANGE
jgi:hypothetical protein